MSGEQMARPHPEMDPGHPEVGQAPEDPAAGREDARLVLLGRQGPDPAVEELDGRGPGRDLGTQRRQGQLGQALEEPGPQAGVVAHERPGPRVVARRARPRSGSWPP